MIKTYKKLDINNQSSILKFIEEEDINFVQWASNPDRIYLCEATGNGSCKRKARVSFANFEEAINILEGYIEEDLSEVEIDIQNKIEQDILNSLN